MANITSLLSLNIIATEDISNNNMVNRSVAPSIDGTFEIFNSYFYVQNGVAPGLTIFQSNGTAQGPAYASYVRNLSPTQSVELSITYLNDATVYHVFLGPGGVFLLWNSIINAAPAVNGTGLGIVLVQAVGSAVNTPIEYFFGG